jgi:hypothetical protein
MLWYRRAVIVFSGLFVVIGVALLAVTVSNDGGTAGYVLGGLFIVLGVARATVERRRGAPPG